MIQLKHATDLLKQKLIGWFDIGISMLPNFIIAILILIIFYFISRILSKLLSKFFDRIKFDPTIGKLLSALTSITIFVFGIFIALGILKLDKTVTSLLAGVGVVGLALSFAFQNAAANLIAGITMALRTPIFVGDLIESNNHFGNVKKIGLRATTITTTQGQDVEIPNRLIIENPYIHFSKNRKLRIDLKCGVSYGENLEKVRMITLNAISSIDYLLKEHPVEFFYEEFSDSSINFVVRYWIRFSNRNADYMKAQSDGIMRIKKSFDEHDITIPFPIRTLDFGIKGGEKLSEMELNLKQKGNNH